MAAQVRECRLFGVRLTPGESAPVVATLLQRAGAGIPGYVCLANVDMLTRARQQAALKGTLDDAAFVLTDGMPLVWALRRLQSLAGVDRLSGPSLTLTLLEQAEALRLAVYFYGGSTAEMAALVQALRSRFPALVIAGAESPPLLPEDPPADPAVIARIQSSGARLVFVGLGCPKQEFWMRTHAPHLPAVCLGVGYAFALLAGTQRRAPSWMQRNGLEWLFRLAQEPGRLWRRYLIGNSHFVALCLGALPAALWRRLRGG